MSFNWSILILLVFMISRVVCLKGFHALGNAKKKCLQTTRMFGVDVVSSMPADQLQRHGSLNLPSGTSMRDSLPSLVVHIRTEKEYGSILDAILSEIYPRDIIDTTYLQELIRFGAVYTSLKSARPPKPRRLIVDDVDGSREIDFDQVNEVKVPVDTYFRVHVNPRRYSTTDSVDWNARIIYNDDHFIAIDKCAGLPVGPTLDNYKENVAFALGPFLTDCHHTQLKLASRLDACTEGLIIYAKTQQAISHINQAFRDRMVQKQYLANCQGSMTVATGRVLHAYTKKTKSKKPGMLRAFDEDIVSGQNARYQRAEMEILSLEPRESTTLVNINLVTGRTHQIRLQCSALGNPIVGDTRYAPVTGQLGTLDVDSEDVFGEEPDAIQLKCMRLVFHEKAKLPFETLEVSSPNNWK